MIFFDEDGEWERGSAIQLPTKKDIVAGNPICHAPVMMRRECLEKVGGTQLVKEHSGRRMLHLGPASYINAVRPMIYGLVPSYLRQALRHKQWEHNN